MKLAINKALEMLDGARGKTSDDYWINHSIYIGNTAGKIAEKSHFDEFMPKKQDIMIAYVYVCLTHPYLNNDVNGIEGQILREIPFRTEFIKNYEYAIYEKMINLCDLMCKGEVMTIERRLIDIIIRRENYENISYHVKESYRLKQYFNEQLEFS